MLRTAYLVVCIAALVLQSAAAQEQRADQCLQTNKPDAFEKACGALDDFMTAFNSHAVETWASTLHFPHVRGGLVRC